MCTDQCPHGGEIFSIRLRTETSSCAQHGVCYVYKVGRGECSTMRTHLQHAIIHYLGNQVSIGASSRMNTLPSIRFQEIH